MKAMFRANRISAGSVGFLLNISISRSTFPPTVLITEFRIPAALWLLLHLILTRALLNGRCYYPHFIDEETVFREGKLFPKVTQ